MANKKTDAVLSKILSSSGEDRDIPAMPNTKISYDEPVKNHSLNPTFPIDRTILESFQQWCNDNEKDPQALINDVLFDFLFNKGRTKHIEDTYIKRDDFESQAKNLIEKTLPTHIQEMARDMSEFSLKIPMWQHLMGVYQLAFDMSLFPQPVIDPGWEAHEKERVTSKCPQCRKTFKPSYLGQLYCTNECGSKAALQGRS